MRKARRKLSPIEQADLAEALARNISSHRLFFNSKKIACYFPVDSEIDPYPVLYRAIDMGKSVYLPVLVPLGTNRLWFAPYQPDCKMTLNQYGIPEPQVPKSKLLAPRALDLVLTPLVGFDKNCNRLGMGGGYYDRTFAFLRNRQSWIKPRLLGIAYDLQRVNSLPHEDWDVPLYGVATESGLFLRNQIP